MARRVIFRPEAVDDLNTAYEWYEDQNPGLGHEFALEISRRIDKVVKSPLLYADIGNGIHRILARKFPFAVYYITNEQDTVVLAVLHCARDPEN
jgi:plasmid stabilization system protein ParE